MWEDVVLYLSCGLLAGLSAGLFGVGGGIVIVPFLVWQLPARGVPDRLVMLVAVATSLAVILVTSVSSVYSHHCRRAIRWGVVRRLAPGIGLGALAGAVIAQRLPVPVFKLVFGVFPIGVAVRVQGRGEATKAKAGSAGAGRMFAIAGGAIGLISSLLGIGGGTLSVPYLLKQGFPIRNAVAISSALGFPIAVVGTATYLVLGWQRSDLPLPSAGYVLLPAFLAIAASSVPMAAVGARWAHRLPSARLRGAFALVLVAAGGRLCWQGLASF